MQPISQNNEQSSQRQSKSQNPIAKKQEQASDVFTCQKCTKMFTNQASYHTHLKNKHSLTKQKDDNQQADEVNGNNSQSLVDKAPEKKNVKKIPFKNRMMEIQQNQLQDTIYAFLGELGQKNAQPVSNRSEFILHNQNQRLTGQTNYSLNKVVRTPYEQPLNASENLPLEQIEGSPFKAFLNILKEQLKQLDVKIQAQKQVWQLRDPMAPQQQTLDEFSLMDIRKLITNYTKRSLSHKFPHFCIYMLWIARICKPQAFKQFFIIIGTYLAQYEAVPQNQIRDQHVYQQWKNYYKLNEGKTLEKELVDKLRICDQRTAKKLVEYFVDWAAIFRAIVI